MRLAWVGLTPGQPHSASSLHNEAYFGKIAFWIGPRDEFSCTSCTNITSNCALLIYRYMKELMGVGLAQKYYIVASLSWVANLSSTG